MKTLDAKKITPPQTAAHTPGPWVAMQNESQGVSFIYPKRSSDDCICTVSNEANARLIAAAPEMLEALKIARDQIETSTGKTASYLNSVIAKATGGAE